MAINATGSILAAAYIGTLGENIGYYGTIIVREVIVDIRDTSSKGNQYRIYDIGKTTLKLITEFGPAEALYSLVIRPAAMGFGAKYFGEEIGVLIGKIAADVIFYISTITSYELKKTFLKII